MAGEGNDPISNQLMGIGNTYATGHVQGQQNDKAHERTIELMDIQHGNQRNLNEHGSNLQYQNWLRTGAPKQVELLKKAGLNPALMYKQNGAQGTTGSQTGGSAGMGQTKIAPYMDIAGLMEQASRTRLNNANANAIEEKLPEDLSNIKSDTGLKNAMAELNKIKIESEKQSIEKSKQEVKKIIDEQGLIGENKKLAIQQFRVNEVEMKFKKAGIKKTNAEIKSIVESIERDWEKVEMDWQKLDNEKKKTKIMEFEKEIKAKYPSIGNVIGRNVNAGANWISTLFGNWDNVESFEVE